MKCIALFIVLFSCQSTFAQLEKKEVKRIERWIKDATGAADAGNGDSAVALAKFYLDYYTTGYVYNPWRSRGNAYRFYNKAALSGCVSCWGSMALILIDSNSAATPLNCDTVLALLEKAAPARDPKMMTSLGGCYQYCRKDYTTAKYWYTIAADAGYADAKSQLAGLEKLKEDLMAKGKEAEDKQDWKTAAEYYKIAIKDKGDPRASFALGKLYADNRLTAYPDNYLITFYYNQAGDNGLPAGYAAAGTVYYDLWVRQGRRMNSSDLTEMRKYWEKGVAKGDIASNQKLINLNQEISDHYEAERKAREKVLLNRDPVYTRVPSGNSGTPATSGVTKKTCPICNGTGKRTDRSTSEKRDWNNKTITMTDHVTTSNCIRCNGTGYISY